MKSEMLPAALRPGLVDIAGRCQAPLDFPAVGAMVALSSVIGRQIVICPKRKDDWKVVPNLWGMIVSPPAALKSPMLNEAMRPVYRLENEAREAYDQARDKHARNKEVLDAQRKKIKEQFIRTQLAISPEQLESELAALERESPTRRRYVVNDATVEMLGVLLNQNPNGLLLFRDELFGFLASMERDGHENDRSFYLEAWNGNSSYSYDRIQRGTLFIEAACVSILGAITPGPLSDYLRSTFSGSGDDGLIQRLQLGVYPDPVEKWVNVDKWPNTEAKNQAFELFKGFGTFGTRVTKEYGMDFSERRFDEDAQVFFDKWRGKLEEKIRDKDEHPVIIGHLGKYRSLMPSLALIFHLCDTQNEKKVVSLNAAKLAAEWCEYLESHMRRIYFCIAAKVDTNARLLGEKIKAKKLPDTFTARNIYRHHWTGLTNPDDVIPALEVLEELSWVKSEVVRPGSDVDGGRPTMRYCVNPNIWDSEKKHAGTPIAPSAKTDKTPQGDSSGTFGTYQSRELDAESAVEPESSVNLHEQPRQQNTDLNEDEGRI